MTNIIDIGVLPYTNKLDERFMFPFSQLNYLLNGGILNRVTLIASGTDNGKSTLSSQIIAEIVKQGYNCCCFFGEDTARESQERIYKQVLGKNEELTYYKTYQVNGKDTNTGEYVLTEQGYNIAKNIFNHKLFLYDTNASTKVDDLLKGFDEARIKYNCKVFLLDNCDQFDLDVSGDNENTELKRAIIKIRDYAINNEVHIFLVCHLRKIPRDIILPELNDIKGTSSIVNISKNIMIVLRTDKMNKLSKQYQSLKKLVDLNGYNLDDADCLIAVEKTKGRKIGFVALKFNKKSNCYYDMQKNDNATSEKVEIVMPDTESKYSKMEMIEVDDISLPF